MATKYKPSPTIVCILVVICFSCSTAFTCYCTVIPMADPEGDDGTHPPPLAYSNFLPMKNTASH